MALNVMFVPPLPKKPVGKPAGALNEATPQAAIIEQAAADTADAEKVPGNADQDAAAPDALPAISPALITLGSMDQSSGYFILATLNNRGGTVERIELTERNEKGKLKYCRVDTPSGYLGYLALEPSTASDGGIIRVVGPGTPAAIAKSQTADVPDGLRSGDLIVAIGSKAISGPTEINRLLDKTKPGEELIVEVVRPTDSATAAAAVDSAVDAAVANTADKIAVTLKFTATLTEHPLDLVRLASTGGVDEVLGNFDRLSCRLTLSQVGQKSIPTGKSAIEGLEWISEALYKHEVKSTETQEAIFTLPVSAKQLLGAIDSPLTITRSYTVAPGSYLIGMDISIRNDGDKSHKLAYRLEGPCGVTLEGWWYSTKISPNYLGGASARDVIYKTEREGHTLISGYDLLKRAKKQPVEPNEPIFSVDEDEAAKSLVYAGIDAQYFDVAYLPPKDVASFKGFRHSAATLVADAGDVPLHKERAADVSFFVDSVVAEVPANASLHQPLRMFAGPKVPELIDSLGLTATIEYGWFGAVSKLLGGLLHWFYSWSGNYVVAIILLTVLVRGLLFPVSRKAAIHAQRMQELAPELKKINDKFKDDMEGKMRAQREFQKRVGFNPLAGCLPAFLQLPIFIGLYRCLSVDIELRQATFASTWQWASNLAGPDMAYYWGDWLWDYLGGRGTGWLGPYFNVLPVIVVILFLVQQKLFMPPPTDEQQAITQKVMFFMTMLMALFFFRVPAGLCVYFITSSIWSIAERIVVKKTLPPAKLVLAGGGDVVEGTITARKAPEKESIADKVRKQFMPPEPPKALPPAKRKKPPGRK